MPSNVQQEIADYSSSRWLPLLLLVLALLDLRQELRLLIDHFTATSLLYAIRHHLLAVAVLASLPSLWRRYGPIISNHS
ncbi:hypothetical protein OMCYN_01241 [cyanobiont of Ornithocercus magnificus]|nr:hypothetical protein OMCYN_01241 [cyanobiont of Ornithocercus magnificus]